MFFHHILEMFGKNPKKFKFGKFGKYDEKTEYFKKKMISSF